MPEHEAGDAFDDLVAALQEIIWKIDHEQPLGNGHALREIARIALERAAENEEEGETNGRCPEPGDGAASHAVTG